ncbi:hypothetical protein VTK56DRAFT_6762 [Thermocarpiscus australiensis]
MPLPFVAARSSRHRRACFALYKSLLRQGLRVPLPDDVATGLGATNPIKTLIRNGFRRNKRDTSPRLIVSALKNGYRFLALLSRAADPATAEHASVLSFLRENQARLLRLRERAAAQAAARVSTAPIPDRVRVLTRVSAPGEHPPVYVPTGPPRPLSTQRNGIRKPPTLDECFGVPFLRFKKPQPRFLERIIRQKSRRRAKRVDKLLAMQNEYMDDADLEDEWEGIVRQMLEKQERESARARARAREERGGKGWDDGLTEPPQTQTQKQKELSYRQTLWDAVVYLSKIVNDEREDQVARGKAMWQIVLAEQEMALKEEKERLIREGRGGEEPKLRIWKKPIWARRRRRRQPSRSRTQENGQRPGQGQATGREQV